MLEEPDVTRGVGAVGGGGGHRGAVRHDGVVPRGDFLLGQLGPHQPLDGGRVGLEGAGRQAVGEQPEIHPDARHQLRGLRVGVGAAEAGDDLRHAGGLELAVADARRRFCVGGEDVPQAAAAGHRCARENRCGCTDTSHGNSE